MAGAVVVNPEAGQLGQVNAILNGRGKRYFVRDFPGPLSVKTVVNGSAAWRTESGRFAIGAESYVLLNDGQAYSMTIEAAETVETFCVFFARGYVEDAWRSAATTSEILLDKPFEAAAAVGFFERLHTKEGVVARCLARLRESLGGETAEDEFANLAGALLEQERGLAAAMARVPAARFSTRQELFRRLLRAREVIEASPTNAIPLREVAAQACLSPFHLQRTFARAFGETPHQYGQRRRLERARQLLTSTEYPVTEVCLEAGFESLGTFSALFRKRYGASPRNYRLGRRGGGLLHSED